MIRKLMSIAMVFLGVVCAFSQQPQLSPMPLNPNVKHGVLPNGLSYYILHNEEPKERANFYIAQKVGSTLETPEQLGLAHFLEHMAFNGTKNYPGKKMLNYLQSKGIRFGADINAYTSFDETVYNIDNIPTTDVALMDSVLLVLHDWSCDLLLDEDEINAERGVIEEEWRGRNDAQFRMLTYVLPRIYDEYQYEQTPIGKMEVVKNFPPQDLRDYYHKWYRPDQQGIVIVGDFDAVEMEKKVIAMFSPIPMPENAAPREYPVVSDNETPKYVYFSDPELRTGMAMISFKYDKTPFELRNTIEMYLQDGVITRIVSSMINNRLEEYSQKKDCKYAYAGVRFDDFWVSKTKGTFDVTVIPKDDVEGAISDAMSIVARACKTGFTDSEYSRVKDELISNYEKAYNERNKTKTSSLAKELIRHFVDNEPDPGIETEYQLVQMVLPSIPVQALNEICKELLTPTNQVVVVSLPDNGQEPFAEEVAIAAVNNPINAEYEAYVDEVITEPLIAKLPKAGKVKSVNPGEFETQIITLSNGVKVVVKPTDFASDQVLLTAFRKGGRQVYPESQAANLKLISAAVENSKVGPFDVNMLRKYLAGKQVSLSFDVKNTVDEIEGMSTVKDLPTMMELIYAYFTSMSADADSYEAWVAQQRPLLATQDKQPMKIFSDAVTKTTTGGNKMYSGITTATLDEANYPEMLALAQKSLSNAADYTFIFTGNVDVETLKPLLEQYIASLPSGKVKVQEVINPVKMAEGVVVNMFKQPMQTPSSLVYIIQNGTIDVNIDNDVRIDLLGDIIGNIYTETLREEEGGTYSPMGAGQLNPNTGRWSLITFFQTNAEMQGKLIERSKAELGKVLENGANEEQFSKVREAALKQYEIKVKTNDYWNTNLYNYERGFDFISGHRAAIEGLTLDSFNEWVKSLYNGKNLIEVVMEGVPME